MTRILIDIDNSQFDSIIRHHFLPFEKITNSSAKNSGVSNKLEIIERHCRNQKARTGFGLDTMSAGDLLVLLETMQQKQSQLLKKSSYLGRLPFFEPTFRHWLWYDAISQVKGALIQALETQNSSGDSSEKPRNKKLFLLKNNFSRAEKALGIHSRRGIHFFKPKHWYDFHRSFTTHEKKKRSAARRPFRRTLIR